MSENEIPDLLLQLLKDNFKDLKDKINELKTELDTHVKDNASALTDIALLEKDIEVLQGDFKDLKKHNDDQHKEFYLNFKSLDRLVYKIIGGMSVGGVIAGFAIKLINKG